MAKKAKKAKTEAEIRAQKKYMERFCEVKVRMTTERRSIVQQHAANMDESTTAFINRAIDETMEQDETALRMGLNPVTGGKLGQL